jgi:hypothetical protein
MKTTVLDHGDEWYIFQPWSSKETHVMRGYKGVAEAPGKSMEPIEAAKLIVQLRKAGWVERNRDPATDTARVRKRRG